MLPTGWGFVCVLPGFPTVLKKTKADKRFIGEKNLTLMNVFAVL